MRIQLFIITFFIGIVESFSQNATIKGTIKLPHGEKPFSIIVKLANTDLVTEADSNGFYQFQSLDLGKYTVVAVSESHEEVSASVEILNSDDVLVADLQLKEAIHQLDDVVMQEYTNKFYTKSSSSASKMPLKNLENPQVYTTIKAELLKEQLTTDFTTALKNTPGLYKISGNRGINTGGATSYVIRGFRTEAAMMDGVPSQTNGEMDPSYVERIEILKGPSATMYGGTLTSFGGMVNLITKKPLDTLGGEISLFMGSFNMHRIAADVYGPINKDKSALFRINTAYQYQNTFQDAGFKKSTFVAPAFEFKPSKRLKINLNAELYQMETTSPPSIFLNRSRQLIARTPDELGFDWKRSYTSNDITMKNPTVNLRAQIHYKLSKILTSQTILSNNTRRSDGYYQYQFIRKATDDSLERTVSYQNTVNSSLDLQQNFIGDFKIGRFRNRIVVGVDYLSMKSNNDNSPYIVFDFVNGLKSDDKNYTKISKSAVDAKINASTLAPTRNHSLINVYSAYASDVFNVTDRFLAMLSLRVDKYDSRGTINHATNTEVANSKFMQTSWSPKLGLVYQVVKNNVSVFANYMNGFSNIAPVTQPLADISGVFKPMQANQYEGGVKLDAFKNRLSFTASYYDITVHNVTRVDVVERNAINYNVTVQNGSQNSKGFEAELIANPIKGLNIIAGFGHNVSKLIKSTVALEGRRPVEAGPMDLVNAWVSYTCTKGQFKGLGVGVGGNYVSRFLTANSATTGDFEFPAYTLLNGSLFYEIGRYRFGVKVENALNERYYVGQGLVAAQTPRNYTANISVRF